MTRLADVALRFCRQCLDWEDARLTASGHVEVPASDGAGTELPRLDPTDLDAVLAAAREFCDGPEALACHADGDDPCVAVMEACLASHRRRMQ